MSFRKRDCAIVAGAALCMFSTTASAVETAFQASIKIGPIPFGANLDEIKASTPGVDWKIEEASEFTGAPLKIAAQDVFDFGGRRVSVQARKDYYDWHVGLKASAHADSAVDCEQAGLQWLASVEGGVGALAADTPARTPRKAMQASWTASQSDGGAFVVMPIKGARKSSGARGEWISFGEGSSALYHASGKSGAYIPRKALATKKPDRFAIQTRRETSQFEVSAYAGYDVSRPGVCSLYATYIGWAKKPALSMISYDPSNIVRTMSIGERHRLIKGLPLPKEGVLVKVNCSVSRQTGETLVCRESESMPIDLAINNAASRIAGAMAFDMTGVDRDDPQEMIIEIPVLVSPDDVRSEEFCTRPRVMLSDVSFSATPRVNEYDDAYPISAKQKGVSARTTAVCEVQSDGSLICLTGWVEQSDGKSDFHEEFAHAAEKLLPKFTAAPNLANGQASIGAVFDVGVVFRLEE